MSNRRIRKLLMGGLVGSLLLLVLLGRFSGVLVDWLWFGQLGFEQIFTHLLVVKLSLGALASVVTFVFVGINLHFALSRSLPDILTQNNNLIELSGGQTLRLTPQLLRWGAWLAAALVTLPTAFFFANQWDKVLRFFYGPSVGRSDPIFGRDLGFYLFELPFWQTLQNSLTFLAFLVFVALTALAFFRGLARRHKEELPHLQGPGSRQLILIFLLLIAGYAWGYSLDRYELLFSSGGAVYGAGYTDIMVVRLGLWAMVAASLALGLTVIYGYLRDRLKIALWGGGIYVALLLLFLLIIPQMVQKFLVEPNELQLETPYLQHEIALTRQAYAIDHIEERAYPALINLTRADIAANQQTLDNIRLWDWRPLLQTFRQLQEIRSYYRFSEVDVDRYHFDGDYRQVMLSARELAPTLPERADTWVNRRLQFTHGYGLTMSLASQQSEEGTPSLVIKDLPPKSPPELELENPAIFYGENMSGFRIVNTGVKELDYPQGDTNVYTRYAGQGGIALDSWWKKLLFAWELGDINILLSDYLQPTSRLQLRREVKQRIATLAPFLTLDADPYLVVSGGRLYWIQDAYTTSDRYPYAEPFQGRFNYIRNAVKAVVDLYQGSVTFYAMPPNEPVLQVYRRAFPEVFRPLSEMPADLKQHLRYPEDLFRVQVDKFNRYHMTIPQVFYNNEDLWTLPREKYAGSPRKRR